MVRLRAGKAPKQSKLSPTAVSFSKRLLSRISTPTLPLPLWLSTGMSALWLLFLLLALLSHSNGWQQGPFTWGGVWLPGGWRVGFLSLLPLLLAVGLAWRWWEAQRSGDWSWGAWRVTLPLVGLTLLAAVNGVIWQWDTAVLMLILFWLVYLSLIHFFPPQPPWYGLIAVIALVIIVQAGVAVAQFGLQRELGLAWLGEPTLTPFERGISVVMNGEAPWLRAYGLNSHPNRLGWKLVLLWLMLWPCQRIATGWLRAVVWLALLSGMAGILVSLSRSAWLAWLAGTAVFLLADWVSWRKKLLRPSRHLLRSRSHLLLVGLMLAGPTLFALAYEPLVVGRFSRPSDALEILSLSERLRDAPLAWQLMLNNPWSGVGLGQYRQAATQLHPLAGLVHATPLLVGAELGMPGFLGWLCLLAAPLLRRDLLLTFAPQTAVWVAIILIGLLQPEPTPFTMQGAILFGMAAALWSVPWPTPNLPILRGSC
ncbi:MAG TPA: O-antigen ligase family protein [Chloroflexota bacterium]|nr:O-antigen ligase family protein [Chloroflexota bacterium]